MKSLSHVWLLATPWTAALQVPLSMGFSRQEYWNGVPLPSPPSPRVYSNSCPLSRWWHPTISSSVFLVSSRLQSFTVSGSFPVSQFFASGAQSFGVSASASGRFRRNLFPCVFQLLETAGSPCLPLSSKSAMVGWVLTSHSSNFWSPLQPLFSTFETLWLHWIHPDNPG